MCFGDLQFANGALHLALNHSNENVFAQLFLHFCEIGSMASVNGSFHINPVDNFCLGT